MINTNKTRYDQHKREYIYIIIIYPPVPSNVSPVRVRILWGFQGYAEGAWLALCEWELAVVFLANARPSQKRSKPITESLHVNIYRLQLPSTIAYPEDFLWIFCEKIRSPQLILSNNSALIRSFWVFPPWFLISDFLWSAHFEVPFKAVLVFHQGEGILNISQYSHFLVLPPWKISANLHEFI